jgi:acetyl-CoA C-acetyltransferase
MGACAEKTALDLKLTRQLSDDYAINSYERTLESQRSGRFAKDIVSVEISPTEEFSQDEEPKRYNKDRFAQLKTVFKKDGTITAANASKLNDGACAIIVASEAKIKEYGLTPLARIVSYADAEVEPVDFCVAPAKSSAKALSRAGLKMRDIQFHEINEAFSTTVLANMKLLDLPIEQVNVWGGAVALGHPLGMSGARIVLNLINILK